MFDQLVAKLPVGICVVDEQYRLQYLNAFFLDRMRPDQRHNYLQQPLISIFPEQAKFLTRRIKSVFVLQHPSFSYWEQRAHIFPFKSSRPITGEETQMYQNMEIVPISGPSSEQKLACIILQDVTAQASYLMAQQELASALKQEHTAQRKLIKKLDSAQSQLIQAEKMASTGQLAAGIAHEINNPIGFVTANLATLKDYSEQLLNLCDALADKLQVTSPSLAQFSAQTMDTYHYELLKEDISPLVDESCEGLNRVRDIVENLKQFALEESTGWQLFNLHETTQQLVKLVGAQYKAPVYKVSCNPPNLQIFCEPASIKQALTNILINAAQSIKCKGFVKIDIRATAQRVSIKVIDSGVGISAENIKKIFDPFFTTKPEGMGQGLGLSVAYTAIEKHKGKIIANSNPGRGTVVEILVPVVHPEQRHECAEPLGGS
ncbi:sensor histidine kinase [Salinimonas sediminis]|uniref:histidine kinase n=1 Tax=Salinimonas sediminis TaxID=2303538 RepID=A0A346NQ98_9ALTE|nr:ATP-binding protein [Salinimonas sediminis]AXR07705.1 histidine kinase [Salinimonas sediminis]